MILALIWLLVIIVLFCPLHSPQRGTVTCSARQLISNKSPVMNSEEGGGGVKKKITVVHVKLDSGRYRIFKSKHKEKRSSMCPQKITSQIFILILSPKTFICHFYRPFFIIILYWQLYYLAIWTLCPCICHLLLTPKQLSCHSIGLKAK